MEIHGMNSTQGISQHNNSEREQSFQQLSTVTTGYQENQNSPSSSSSSLSAASTSSTASSILTAASTVSSTSSSAFPSLMGDELHSASGAPSSTHYFPPLNLADHSSHSPKSIQSSINPSSSSFQQSINANQSRNPLSARSNDGEHDSNYTDNNLNQPKSMNSFQQNEMYTSGPNGSEYANYSSSQYANNAFHQQYDSLPPSALPAGGMASNHSNGTNNNPTAANTSSSLLRHSITCLECSYPLDDDDLSFAPCQCGARLCLLCFDSHLSQSTECPACRRTISIGQFSQQFIDEYRMAIQVKVERRQQQQQHSNLNGGVSAHGRSGFPAHQNANQNYVNVNQQQQQQNQSPFSANRKKFVRSPQLAPQGAHHSPVFNAANAPSHLGSAHPQQHQHQHQLLNPGANVGVNANQHSPNFGAVNVSVNGNNPNSPGPVLTSARVLQRNLMYVVGLPVHLAKEDILKKKEYFGKFGKIIKIAISKKTVNANQKGESSSPLSSGLGAPNERSLYSAYVTFKRDEDCATSIRCTNGANLGGSIVRATYGTNKYCSWFLKGQPCNSSQCLYLHSSAPDEDCCTKEDLLVMDKLAKMNINAEREELKHAQNDDSIIHQFISGMSQQQLQNFAQLAQTINVYQLNYLSFLVPVISEVLNMNINVERTPNTQERHLALNSHATQNATNAVNRSTFHSAFFTQQQQQQQTLALAQQQVQVLSNPRDRSSSGGNGSAGNASGNTNVTSNVATVGANGGARMAQLQSNRSGAQLLTVQNTAPIRLSPVDGLHQGGVNYDAAIQQQLTTSASWSTGGSSDFHAYSSRSGYANYNASNQSPQPHAQSHSQSQSPNQIVRSSHSASSTPSILPGRSVPSPPPGTSSASSASGASSSRSSPQVFSSRSAYSPLGATNELPPASSSSHAHVQSDYVKSIYEEGSLLDQPNATSRGGFDDYPPTQHEHYASSRSGPVDSVHNTSNPNNANFHYQTYQQQQQGSNSPYSQKQLLQSQQQKEYTVSNIRNSSRFYTQQPQQQASAYLGDLAASDSHSASEQSGYAASASALASSAITGNSMNSMFQTLSLADNEITRKKANQNLTASPADGGYSLFNNSFNSSVSSSAPPSLNGSPSRSMTLPIGKRSVSPSYVNAFPLMNLNVNSAASLNYGGAPNNFQLPSSAVQLSGADKSANTNEWNVQTSSATNGNMSGINEDNGPNSAPSSTSASSSAHTMSFFGSSTSPFHAFHPADASPAISTATLSQSHPAALSSPFLHYKQPQKTDGTKADQQASLFTLF